MLLAKYAELNDMEKAELIDVACNRVFRQMLSAELAEVEEALLEIPVGSDEKQFMLDYQQLQNRREELKAIQDLIKEIRLDHSHQLGIEE